MGLLTPWMCLTQNLDLQAATAGLSSLHLFPLFQTCTHPGASEWVSRQSEQGLAQAFPAVLITTHTPTLSASGRPLSPQWPFGLRLCPLPPRGHILLRVSPALSMGLGVYYPPINRMTGQWLRLGPGPARPPWTIPLSLWDTIGTMQHAALLLVPGTSCPETNDYWCLGACREGMQAGMDACGQEEAISEPQCGAAHPPSKRTPAPRFALIWH